MVGLRHILILSVLVALYNSDGYAQSPNLRCLAVDAAGDVAITWVQPSDSCGSFTNYQIFYANFQVGPYTLIDSISNFNTTTYVHLAAGADVGSAYYYIVSNSGCANVISDTLQSIFLTVLNTPAGVTNLNWNSLHSPELTTNGIYSIFREDTLTGIMQFLDSAQTNTHTDPFTFCDTAITVDYQLFITDSTGCISSSSIAELMADFIQPLTVTIDSVSVDPVTGLATISWTPSASADAVAYNIFAPNENLAFAGSVSGASTTFFMDPFSDNTTNPGPPPKPYTVDSNSVTYTVAVVDKCGNISPASSSFSTIFLWGQLDTCLGQAELNWNAFINWPTGVSNYEVFMNTDGGAFVLAGSTTGTTYTQTGLLKDSTYCYFIRAINGAVTKTSSSNIMCSYTDTIPNSSNPSSGVSFELDVEARDSVKNVLTWTEAPSWSSLITSYNIYRSVDGGSYQLIGNRLFGTTTFIDSLDPLSDFRSGRGNFCYFVVPVLSGSNLYICIDTSSIECVTQFPKYVVPNTFTPNGDGLNDVFLPIRVFIDRSNYLFIIYTRWGQKVFETTDAGLGWDGLIGGFVGANDAYVYYVEFTINGDDPRVKAGTVLLIR